MPDLDGDGEGGGRQGPPTDTAIWRITVRDRRLYEALWRESPADFLGEEGGVFFNTCFKTMLLDHMDLEDTGQKPPDLETFAAYWRPPTYALLVLWEVTEEKQRRRAHLRSVN
jgi:hypothetical protein